MNRVPIFYFWATRTKVVYRILRGLSMIIKTKRPIQLEFDFCDKYPINLRQAYRCPLCGYDPKLSDHIDYLVMHCPNYTICDFGIYSITVDARNVRRSEAQYILIHKWNKFILNYLDEIKGKKDIIYPPLT